MIWHKKEGCECRRGINFLFGGGGFGIILFMAGYKWRMKVGFYLSRQHEFHNMYERWDLEKDIKDYIWERNLYTHESMLNEVDKRLVGGNLDRDNYNNHKIQFSDGINRND